jgi:hypothetical protein
MCRKLVLLILVLCMASTSYGAVIGNWEGTGMDTGWISAGYGTITTQQSTGATLDSYSMKMVGAANSSGSWAFKIGTSSPPNTNPYGNGVTVLLLSDFTANYKISMDVTRLTTDWTYTGAAGSAWSAFDLQMTAYDGSGVSYGTVDLTPSWGAGKWTGNNSDMMTVTWDYSAYMAGKTAFTGMKMAIGVKSTGFTTGGIYYIDNVRLTPEPATMALFGLGGLALLRKRRA